MWYILVKLYYLVVVVYMFGDLNFTTRYPGYMSFDKV